MKRGEFLKHLQTLDASVRDWCERDKRLEVYCTHCLDTVYVLPEIQREEVPDELVSEVEKAIEEHTKVHDRSDVMAVVEDLKNLTIKLIEEEADDTEFYDRLNEYLFSAVDDHEWVGEDTPRLRIRVNGRWYLLRWEYDGVFRGITVTETPGEGSCKS